MSPSFCFNNPLRKLKKKMKNAGKTNLLNKGKMHEFLVNQESLAQDVEVPLALKHVPVQ